MANKKVKKVGTKSKTDRVIPEGASPRSGFIPPVHARWKPGQSGNPAGGPKDPPEIKKIKNLTKIELIEVANLIIKGNLDELMDLKDNPDASVLQVMIAGVAIRVMKKGDMTALDILLNRLIGKVKDEIDINGDIKMPQIIVKLPSNGKEAK
jgi:hypothetical protein